MQIHKKIRIFCVLLICTIGAANASTLGQVVKQTLYSNPQIESARANILANKHRLSEARGGLLPEINLTAAGGRENSDTPTVRALNEATQRLFRREAGASLTQLLFNGWRTSNQIKQQNANVQVSQSEYLQTQENVTLDIATAYLNVMRTRRLEQLAISNVSVHKQTLHDITRRFKAGAGRRVQVSLAKSRLASALARLSLASGNVKQAIANYIAVTGQTPPKKMTMPSLRVSRLPTSYNQALSIAVHNNPELNAALNNIKSTEAAVGVAKSAFYPTLNVDVNYDYDNDLDGLEGRNEQFTALVRARYNLFNGGSDRAALGAAEQTNYQATSDAAQAHRNIVEDLRSAWVALKVTQRQIPELTETVAGNVAVVKDYRKEFELGQRGLFNVLDAENDLFQSRNALTNVRYDQLLSSYRILATMGRLTSTLIQS